MISASGFSRDADRGARSCRSGWSSAWSVACLPEITAFEADREPWRPRTLPARHLPPAEVVAARPVAGAAPHADDALG